MPHSVFFLKSKHSNTKFVGFLLGSSLMQTKKIILAENDIYINKTKNKNKFVSFIWHLLRIGDNQKVHREIICLMMQYKH